MEARLRDTGRFEPEYREYGLCGALAIEEAPNVATAHICDLVAAHEGSHSWDHTN